MACAECPSGSEPQEDCNLAQLWPVSRITHPSGPNPLEVLFPKTERRKYPSGSEPQEDRNCSRRSRPRRWCLACGTPGHDVLACEIPLAGQVIHLAADLDQSFHSLCIGRHAGLRIHLARCHHVLMLRSLAVFARMPKARQVHEL